MRNSTMTFFGDKMDVARFAADMAAAFGETSLSITITQQGSSEVYSVFIATDTLLDAIAKKAARLYYLQRINIS